MNQLPEVNSTEKRPRRRRAGAEDPLAPSFTIMRVRGIRIGAHWTWVLVFGLIAWSLSDRLFPSTYPGLSDRTYLVMGIVTAVVFFASILLHELGHSFRAIREGMKVGDITLWLFGGVARFEGMFPSAGAEFRIAIAGPIVSVVLAGIFYLVALAAQSLDLPLAFRGGAEYLARINAIVVAFNMVPALPLDGGRVLRSWLWHRQQSFTAATISAARAGKAFAYVLIAFGILGLFNSAFTGGIWFIFLGWFLLQAAQGEAAFVVVRRAFRGLTVRDLMTPDPVVVDPNLTINEFLNDVVKPKGHSAYPVVEHGRIVGLISLKLAGEVPQEDRDEIRVHGVMLTREETPTFASDTPVMDAFAALRSPPGRGIVLDHDRLIGIVSVSDVSKVLELEEARGFEPTEQARRAGTLVWVIVFLAIALAAGAFYHPPLAVVMPGPTENVTDGIEITGVPSGEVNGEYLLVTVRVDQPSALGAIYAFFHPEQNLIPLSTLIPEGVEPREFTRQQRSIFRESRMIAAAAAGQAVGLDVSIEGTGARVLGVLPDAPANGILQNGDVLTAANGEAIKTILDLRRIVTSKPAGTNFAFQVERDGETLELSVASRQFQDQEGLVAIGVLVETRDLNVDLPFEITFEEEEDIGGPSAGLAYALAIADMLDERDLAQGRTIAASGTILLGGDVGAVGGLAQKRSSAQDADAGLFLVPVEDLESVRNGRIDIRGVDTLQDAIAILVPPRS